MERSIILRIFKGVNPLNIQKYPKYFIYEISNPLLDEHPNWAFIQ